MGLGPSGSSSARCGQGPWSDRELGAVGKGRQSVTDATLSFITSSDRTSPDQPALTNLTLIN